MGLLKTVSKKTLSKTALVVGAVVGVWELQWLGKSSLAFVIIGLAGAVCLLAGANLAGKE